ncbi:transposase [Streptomyces fodineus]|uniref:transposase n=1 Tax=Streptomyces fodineus TaxID=1904616 RepID=UPI00131D331E
MTTLLDARRYPARQLAALYYERWEAEAVFAELKTHQRGRPHRVEQQDPRRRLTADLGAPAGPPLAA